MFIAALFTTARTWKQPKCPSTEEWIKKIWRGFPGGAVVENPPANVGDTGSSPGPGRSHMPRSNEVRVLQLLKPARLESVLRNKRSHRKSNACSPLLEKAGGQQ